MNAKQEREHYELAVIDIMTKYDVDMAHDPEHALTNATKAYINKFYPKSSTPQIEAFVRMSLLNIENMLIIAGTDNGRREEVRNAWGHIVNCLIDAAIGDWTKLNTYTLA